jgi:hypothetical protein
MDVVFAQAFAAAFAIHGPVVWPNLSQREQTDTIYREMRRLDLEYVSGPVVVGPVASEVSLQVAA